jgi:two-component system sensor histidine kinase DegS
METGSQSERRRARFEALYAEAKQALSYAANQVRALTERAREVHGEAHGALDRAERLEPGEADLVHERAELHRLELAVQSLEHDWLFLERGTAESATPADHAGLGPELQMRVLEAQEAERVRLSQEIHDGPAQALANAAFLVDIIDRTMDHDTEAARDELRSLRAILQRELDEMRGFVNQLRPPLLDQLGLDGAVRDAAAQVAAGGQVHVETDLQAPDDLLNEAQQTVALRIAQEALRNVHKHAAATKVHVSTRLEPAGPGAAGTSWVLRVEDDGRGFDEAEAMLGAGRRRFGLRFMRDRAVAIGADLAIETRPATGTTVRLTMRTLEGRSS